MHNKINLRIRIISSAQAEKVSSPKPQESLCISSSILSSRYKSLSLALKQSQYDSNHSASSSADVQNLARKTAQGRSSSVGIATRYSRTVKDRITVGVRLTAPVPTGPAAHTASSVMGIGSLYRG